MSPEVGGPVKVFISYSHDTPEHMSRVLSVSNRLRKEGIDCKLDQYVMSPPEGWPQWMQDRIEEADFVLVVCTEVYCKRVQGEISHGEGLGAKWEGQIITQEIYESAGLNEKFIPVIFRESDISNVPIFLRSVTRYNLTNDQDYEKLYRHLTNQPHILMPQLGEIRKLSPEVISAAVKGKKRPIRGPSKHGGLESLILLNSPDGLLQFISSKSVELGEQLNLVLLPTNSGQTVFLSRIKDATKPVGVAYGDTALMANVRSVTQRRKSGIEEWIVVMAPADIEYGGGFLEISTSTLSADELAEMRARRILLDETLESSGTCGVEKLHDGFLEALVRGQSTPIQVERSPFPELYKRFKHEPVIFLAIARLVGIYYLRLSGVVEHILRFDLSLSGENQLEVDFEGQRARKYMNVDPPVIRVRGNYRLE